MYSREVIDEVIARNDIVDVISQYVQLKRSGSSYMGLCPFHNEKSPSFSVSGQRQLYHCFGCGVGGNVISFVMEYENMSFLEAVKMLGDRAGVALPETHLSEQDRIAKSVNEKLLEINKIAAIYYYKQLRSKKGKAGLEYLKKRELSDATINGFGLGFAPQTTGELYKHLKDSGYDDELLKKSGLFTYENGIHEKFWNRVIYPIMDLNNRVIGFGGRVMGDAKPKYLNSPETPIFNKSNNLYGLNLARRSRKSNLIICEGYMDVISMHQAGFSQAVASLGTALTERHAALLKRFTDNVLITYDSDEAGVKAALRAIPMLKNAGLSTRVINMRPYKDPDEFIKAMGAEAFQERIDKAENSFMYEIGVIEKDYDRLDPESETEFETQIAEKLARFEQKLERENYLKAVCRDYSISEDGMSQLVNKIGGMQGIMRGKQVKTEEALRAGRSRKTREREDGVSKAEKMLLTWIISDRDVYEKVKEYIVPEDFDDALFTDVAGKVYEQYENGNISPASIISCYDSAEEQNEVAAMFSADLDEELSSQEREKTLNDIVVRIMRKSLEQELNATTDMRRMQELITRQQKLGTIHISL